jgi:hypothetical protein
MPEFIKHVGQVNQSNKKCVVVFREIPGEESSCLIVETESLPELYHDDLINAVESHGSQSDMDFYKFAQRSTFHDGTNMLESLHLKGLLKKVSVNEITMIPTRDATILLADLNSQLRQINNEGRTTSGDINATVDEPQESNSPGTLSDKQIANQMRSQAEYFQREANRLLKEAEALDPGKTVNSSATEAVVDKPKRKYTKKK